MTCETLDWQSPDWQVARVASIGSTQDSLRASIQQLGAQQWLAPSVLQAGEQQQGRGQRARDWHSAKGGAYQSFAIADADKRLYQPYLPLAIAVGLASVLREEGVQVGVKWSNDLIYKNKKLAGILCEVVRSHLLIGVGVNVNNPVPNETAIALQGWRLEHVYSLIITGVTRGLHYCATKADIAALFAPFDVLMGKKIRLEQAQRSITGIAQGVDARGCLLLDNGRHVCWTDPERGRVRLLPC